MRINSIQQLRYICDKSFYWFCKVIGGSVNQGRDIIKEIHKPFCDAWQDPSNKRIGAGMARGQRKTVVLTGWDNIWTWLQDPEERQLIGTEKERLGTDILKWIKTQLMQNKLLRKVYEDKLKWVDRNWIKNNAWKATAIELPKKGLYTSPSIQVLGIRGAAQGGHFTCLCEGSLVYTSNGLVPIEDMQPHMRVLTRTGKHSEVTHVLRELTSQRKMAIALKGQPEPIRCTEDHKTLIYRDGSLSWMETKNIKIGDYTAMPIPSGHTRAISRTNKKINELLETPSIWRFIGYWLAEGCATKRKNRIRLTFGSHEMHLAEDTKQIIEEYCGVPVSIRPTKSSTLMVNFSHSEMKEILSKFGTHAYNKHIPPLILSNLKHLKVELIKGYLRGDGHNYDGGWAVTSTSRSLLAGIQLLLASLEIPSNISIARKKQEAIIMNNHCYTKDAWGLQTSHPLLNLLMGTKAHFPKTSYQIKIIPGYVLFPVKDIQTINYDNPIYDISVNDGESFVVPGACVHNTIHLDDIIGQAATESQIIMEDAFFWLDNLSELLVEPDYEKINGSRIKITGSPWGSGDIYDYIRKEYPEYKWMISPCQKDESLRDEENLKWIQNPNVEQGESNFPLFPTSYYEDLKAKKPYIYWTQHACQPQKATGLHKFEYDWLRFFRLDERDKGLYLICLDDNDKDTEEIFPLSDIKLYGIIDPGAFAEVRSRKGSRNAILIGGQAKESIKKFVVCADANRIKEPEKFIDVIFAKNKEWKPRRWDIETVAAQNYIYEDIKAARGRRGEHLHISPLDRDVRKDAKDSDIQALINPFFNGEIYIHRSMKDLIGEYRDYPHGLTNDLIDCLGKLFRYHMSRKERQADERPRHSMDDTQAGRSLVSGY